jgi:hypothetical protein
MELDSYTDLPNTYKNWGQFYYVAFRALLKERKTERET